MHIILQKLVVIKYIEDKKKNGGVRYMNGMILWIITIILLMIFLVVNIALPSEKGKKIKWLFAIAYLLGFTAIMHIWAVDLKKEALYAIVICNLLLLADAGILYWKNKEDKKVLKYALSEAFVIAVFNILITAFVILW